VPERPIARAVAAVAIVVLAAVSLPRLRLGYDPEVAFAELTVVLRLPEATDSEDVARRWAVPVEGALRAAGDVIATRGEVDANGARITARFRRGVDAELKAARLATDLVPLRARLPRGATLAIWPARSVQPSAVLAVPPERATMIAEQLRAAPGVREVETYGSIDTEVDVRMRGDAVPDVADALLPHPLGRNVVAAPRAKTIADLHLDATITSRRPPPATLARVDGQPAALLFVTCEGLCPAQPGELWSDAAELQKLLRRLALGMLAAAILFAAGGALMAGPRGLLLGAYIPLAAAIFVNICRVASLRVDAQTLVMALIAFAAVAPFAKKITIVFVLLLPLAAAFGSGALAPLLAPAARDFAIAALCALAAGALLPPLRATESATAPLARGALRAAASVVLAVVAAAVLLLSWFGDRLDPRRSRDVPQSERLYVRVAQPSGSTLAQSSEAALRVERALRRVDGVARFWTFIAPERATTTIELGLGTRAELARIQLQSALPPGARIDDGVERAAAFDEEIGERPQANEEGTLYRFLLKGTDAASVRRAADAIAGALARVVPRQAIASEWPDPSPRIVLVPHPGVAPEAAARELAQRTTLPPARRLPDDRLLRVAAAEAPKSDDDVPQRADLFPRIESRFDIRRDAIAGRLTRELGRFVLPVTVRIGAPLPEEILAKRKDVDRIVSMTALPSGVTLERPSIASWTFSMAKLRLAALAAFLPLLLFTAAAIVLSSLRGAAIALAPAAAGLALVAPALTIAGAQLDELTLLAAGGALCAVVARAVAAMREQNAYRALRRNAAATMVSVIATATMLIVAARDPWRAPLLAAAAALLGGVPAAIILPGAIAAVARDLRARRRPPPAPEGPPRLAVRNVTKVYAGGVRALHRISFDLEPGVIGLLGPNGAGKTTLLRILTGLLQPTRGGVSWRGAPIDRAAIGFLPQEFNAYGGLTAEQFLAYWALERGITAPIDELLALVGLEKHATRRVRDFSGGMRQRIGIARALLGDPPLLIVDEPTTGLDVEARLSFRELMSRLARDHIVILSTHIASDLESTASRLLLLARGTLRFDGTAEALIARARGRVFESVVSDAEARALTQRTRVTTRVRVAGGVRVRGVAAEDDPLPGAAVEPTLEEAYLSEVAAGGRMRGGSFAFVFERTIS